MTRLTIGKDGFTVDADTVATGRTCIIGASGSGKSYTVGVLCEELCKAKVPFALIDTEGEYSSLKGKFDMVWIADEEKADERWGSFSVEELASQATTAPPLILDVSESTGNGRHLVDEFLTALYKVVDSKPTPYLVIIEEADKFIPQVGEALPIVGEIARRGRKRGLGLVLCTQRPSLVDKDTLSQCSNQLIGRLEIRNDLASVTQFFPGRDLPKQLTALAPGEFYVMGNLSPEPQKVQIRERETVPGGVSPKLAEREIKPLALTTRYLPPTADVTILLRDGTKASQFEGLVEALQGKGTAPLNIALIKSVHIKPGSKVEVRYKDQAEVVES
ncbi:MAG TPA: DUF87 domain-containing protein [Nitrososphaerales archaeon]|nr:DUF87 domain-containing protein [Nitrososphaerales archaeon]